MLFGEPTSHWREIVADIADKWRLYGDKWFDTAGLVGAAPVSRDLTFRTKRDGRLKARCAGNPAKISPETVDIGDPLSRLEFAL